MPRVDRLEYQPAMTQTTLSPVVEWVCKGFSITTLREMPGPPSVIRLGRRCLKAAKTASPEGGCAKRGDIRAGWVRRAACENPRKYAISLAYCARSRPHGAANAATHHKTDSDTDPSTCRRSRTRMTIIRCPAPSSPSRSQASTRTFDRITLFRVVRQASCEALVRSGRPRGCAPPAWQRLVPSGFFACRPCGFAAQRKIPPSRRPC